MSYLNTYGSAGANGASGFSSTSFFTSSSFAKRSASSSIFFSVSSILFWISLFYFYLTFSKRTLRFFTLSTRIFMAFTSQHIALPYRRGQNFISLAPITGTVRAPVMFLSSKGLLQSCERDTKTKSEKVNNMYFIVF